MNDLEEGTTAFNKFELFYRNLPGRILVLPLLAASSSKAFFDGTWVDAGFAVLTGLVAGCIHYVASKNPTVGELEDMLVSIVTAMISTMAATVLPDSTCFLAQVLGTLFTYLYGVAFMVSLYEIYNRQLVTGVTRLALALINSYGLAFGAAIGLWLAWYGGGDRFDLASQDCDNLDDQVPLSATWIFYLLTMFGALMELRVGLREWPICIAVQIVAVSAQYLMTELWDQPAFIANVLPTFIATVFAHALITCLSWCKLSPHLEIPLDAFRRKIFQKESTTSAQQADDDSNTGWESGKRSGYMRDEVRRHYKSTDLWFCILPAIFLLVPGTALLRNVFETVLAPDATSTQKSIDGLVAIGLSLAIGVRLALAILGIGLDGYVECAVERCRERLHRSN